MSENNKGATLYVAPDVDHVAQEELKKAYELAVDAKKLEPVSKTLFRHCEEDILPDEAISHTVFIGNFF